MPSKAQDAHSKKVEDKTFGMKNKNKSKQVQKQIAQMKSSRVRAAPSKKIAER